jgi:single-strand DNA-binding protein
MNVITIAGTLGKDAELRYTPNNDPVANFSIADNIGKDKEPIWWPCALFGKRAETLSKYLVKGQAVTISGSVYTNAYKDKQGIDRISYNVRVNDVALQGGKRDTEPKQEKPKGSQGSGFDDMGDCPF